MAIVRVEFDHDELEFLIALVVEDRVGGNTCVHGYAAYSQLFLAGERMRLKRQKELSA